MFNRKNEGSPRSEILYESAGYYPFFPIIDEESLRLARLFAEEEKLAALIADDNGVVDQYTVFKIVNMARKIAREGYPIKLVSVDDMLDIAQIFYARNAKIASSYPRFPRDSFDMLLAQVAYPDQATAGDILIDLLASLKESGNSAWTARVAAALAYFSLQGPSS